MTKETVTTGLGELGPVKLEPSKPRFFDCRVNHALVTEASFLRACGYYVRADALEKAAEAIGLASANRIREYINSAANRTLV